MRYVIQAEQTQTVGEETQHIPCSDGDADIFAVYRYKDGTPEGDAELVEDFKTRADAETWIKGAEILDNAFGDDKPKTTVDLGPATWRMVAQALEEATIKAAVSGDETKAKAYDAARFAILVQLGEQGRAFLTNH